MGDLWHRLNTTLLRGLMRLVGCLPARLASESLAAIAALYARLGGPRIDDGRINLELAFPDWTSAERKRVLIESFANLGRGAAEVCLLGGRARDEILRSITVEGLEYLEAARAKNESGGVLVITGHFGSWEMCAAAMAARGFPVSVVHHAFDNPHLEEVITGWRQDTAGLETLQLGAAGIGIVRALKRGRAVALLMDQNAKPHEGVFAPFFSVPACTRVGPFRLAMKQGWQVVPVFFYREGGRHVVRFEPALEIDSAGEDEEAALITNVTRMNARIEAAIRRAPENWIWIHRRWKTRPADDPVPVYPSRRSLLRSLRHWGRGRAEKG